MPQRILATMWDFIAQQFAYGNLAPNLTTTCRRRERYILRADPKNQWFFSVWRAGSDRQVLSQPFDSGAG